MSRRWTRRPHQLHSAIQTREHPITNALENVHENSCFSRSHSQDSPNQHGPTCQKEILAITYTETGLEVSAVRTVVVQDGADTVTDAYIEETIPHAKTEIRRKTVEKLTPDQCLLYEILRESGETEPSDLYEAYQERAENPKTERTVRNHLQKLQHYNLVQAEGQGRAQTYRPLT